MSINNRHCILLIEDNPADVELVREILCQLQVPVYIHNENDGENAMSILMSRTGKTEVNIFDALNGVEVPIIVDICRPDLILLDLNMPRKDGFEVIQEVRSMSDICVIPIVVLTTSTNDSDVERAYKYGANSYITKPVDFDEFVEIIDKVMDFWINVNRLPKGNLK